MRRQHHQRDGGGGIVSGGKPVWDTGSSLYDSYELAAVRRLLDRSLAGVRLLSDEPPPAVPGGSKMDDGSSNQAVVVSGDARRRAGRKKVTLRRLFRAVVSWAIGPRRARARARACTCVGVARGGAVEPVASSDGRTV